MVRPAIALFNPAKEIESDSASSEVPGASWWPLKREKKLHHGASGRRPTHTAPAAHAGAGLPAPPHPGRTAVQRRSSTAKGRAGVASDGPSAVPSYRAPWRLGGHCYRHGGGQCLAPGPTVWRPRPDPRHRSRLRPGRRAPRSQRGHGGDVGVPGGWKVGRLTRSGALFLPSH
jgi:hypothetical protein